MQKNNLYTQSKNLIVIRVLTQPLSNFNAIDLIRYQKW